MTTLFQELRRRNVFRVAGVYIVVGWLLAQVATTLEEALGLPVWFDGLIVAVLLLGLPVAIVLAWAFELTPEGVVRDSAASDAHVADSAGVRPIDFGILAAMVLLIGLVAWQQWHKEATPVAPSADMAAEVAQAIGDASIAVLPFADLSPDADQAYFADGISEEILNVLAKVDGLDVVSRTSSFQFKGEGLGVPEIAERLRVRHVLEGSVRKAGDVLRITAQLIDTEDDFHAWSESYDRPLTAENIFVIQDDIATSIVAALSDVIGIEGAPQIESAALTQDVDAYDLFLKARTLFQSRRNLVEAEAYLKQAVAIDPEFAQAWELLAAAHELKWDYGYLGPEDDRQRQTAAYIEKALSIDANSSTALALRAQVIRNRSEDEGSQIDWVAVIEQFSRAIAADPRNTEALNWRGLAWSTLGFLDRSLADFEACMDAERFYSACIENHYTILASMQRDQETLEAYRQALYDGAVKVYFAPTPFLARVGEELAFLSATNDALLLNGWRRQDELYRAMRNLNGADHSELAASLRRFAESRDFMDQGVLSSLLIPLGDYSVLPIGLFIWDESHRGYRRSDEFKSLVRQTGVSDYWRREGFPPQCRPIGSDDFSCVD